MTFGEIVKKSRLSRRRLGQECGVSAATICNILQGKFPANWREVRPKVIRALAKTADEKEIRAALTALKKQETQLRRGNAARAKTEEEKTMILKKQILSARAKRHFKMDDPFKEPESTEDVYLSDEARYVYESLLDAARNGNFMGVYGRSGAGKTVLAEELEARLLEYGENIVIIKPSIVALAESDKKGKQLSPRDIAIALIKTIDSTVSIQSDSELLFRDLRAVLIAGHQHKQKFVLLIEEAHELTPQTLKTLKRMWELKQGRTRLLSIIMIGREGMYGKIAKPTPDLIEVSQRCELVELPPVMDIRDFLKFRFARVGVNVEDVFDHEAFAELQRRLTIAHDDKGKRTLMAYPLAIENLVAAVLNDAAKNGMPKVTADVIREVKAE